jgi:hypothetical protein
MEHTLQNNEPSFTLPKHPFINCRRISPAIFIQQLIKTTVPMSDLRLFGHY